MQLQKWNSVVGTTAVPHWSTETDSLLNQVDFIIFQNVIAGYTLLSR